MIDTHQLREDLQTMRTCAPRNCVHEARCFRIAQALRALWPVPVSDPDLDEAPVESPVESPDWSGS